MTLDEAIKHAEEVAEEKENEGKLLCQSEAASIGCLTCAEEHRQLAEWLKDYKRLLEQEPKAKEAIKMHDATPEERESIAKYIKSISKPTGVDLWDLEQEPCDCISRADLISLLIPKIKTRKSTIEIKDKLIPLIKSLNPIQPKTGHWIIYGRGYEKSYECDNCKKESLECGNYCPNCGCRMVSHKKGAKK